MHKCAAVCCENETYSIQKVHNCVENCGASFVKAQQYVQDEFERSQVIKSIYLLLTVVNRKYFVFNLRSSRYKFPFRTA